MMRLYKVGQRLIRPGDARESAEPLEFLRRRFARVHDSAADVDALLSSQLAAVGPQLPAQPMAAAAGDAAAGSSLNDRQIVLRDASDDDTNMASSPVSRGAMDRSVENDDHDDANPDDAIDDPDDGASWLAAA